MAPESIYEWNFTSSIKSICLRSRCLEVKLLLLIKSKSNVSRLPLPCFLRDSNLLICFVSPSCVLVWSGSIPLTKQINRTVTNAKLDSAQFFYLNDSMINTAHFRFWYDTFGKRWSANSTSCWSDSIFDVFSAHWLSKHFCQWWFLNKLGTTSTWFTAILSMLKIDR